MVEPMDDVGVKSAGPAPSNQLRPACTLGLQEGAERMRRWRALSELGHPSARRSGHRLEVRYQLAPGVGDELEALAAAERQCCSSVGWDVRREEGQPVLYVTADPARPADVAPIAALFRAD
jgi:hypothetical protein